MRMTPSSLALIVLALSFGPAWAGRPLVTEDAGVLERGACEFESFAASQRQRGSPQTSGASIQVGCGVLAGSQIALAASRDRSEGESSLSLTLSGKTALNAPSRDGAAFTLAWGLAGARSAGQSSYKHEDTFVTAVASKPVADGWTLHGNLGWSNVRSLRQTTTGWAAAVEHETTEALSLMAEVFGSDRDRAPWVQVAARWALVPERVFVDASWGVQTRSDRPRLVTVGLKVAF